MQRRTPHFSRPVYEGLPWVYIILGLSALLASYLLAAHGLLSLMMGIAGIACVLGGIVVLLRRRDFRTLRSHYADPDSPSGNERR